MHAYIFVQQWWIIANLVDLVGWHHLHYRVLYTQKMFCISLINSCYYYPLILYECQFSSSSYYFHILRCELSNIRYYVPVVLVSHIIRFDELWRLFPMRVCLSTLYSIDLIYWMLKYWMDEYGHERMHYPDHYYWWNRGKMNMKMESEDFVLYTVVSMFSIFSLLCWHHLLRFM